MHNPNKLRNLNKIIVTSALALMLALTGCAGNVVATQVLPPPPYVGTVQLSGGRAININSSATDYKVNIPAFQQYADVLYALPDIASGHQFTVIHGETATGFNLTHQHFSGVAQFNILNTDQRATYISPQEREFMTDGTEEINGMTFAPPKTTPKSFVVISAQGNQEYKNPLELNAMTAATELAQVIDDTNGPNPNSRFSEKDVINNVTGRMLLLETEGLNCTEIDKTFPDGFSTLDPNTTLDLKHRIIRLIKSDTDALCAFIEKAIAQTVNGKQLQPLFTEK